MILPAGMQNVSIGQWCDFEDPKLDARHIAPAWAADACEDVLEVVSGVPARLALGAAMDLQRLTCRVRIIKDAARNSERIVFSESGLDLQLELRVQPNMGRGIMTSAVAVTPSAAKRALLLRRLADLVEHGTLRRELYPSENRAPRFARILQALDGAMTGARHRDIAVGLFGERRVEEDWMSPDNHMRDHVRRAISNGRALLGGGFARLLT